MTYKLLAGLACAALMVACGGNDTTNTQTTVSTGIEIPTNAVEIADGVYVYQDGEGNWMQIDLEVADTSPRPTMIAQSGSNNAMTVTVHQFVPPPEPPAEAQE